VLIDLIFAPAGLEMTDAVFERADSISVMAVAMPVMALEDVLATKLLAIDEHSLNYGSLLGIARSLREQIDWPALESRTTRSPYARAFFTLVNELGIAPSGEQLAQLPSANRVRVLTSEQSGESKRLSPLGFG
jgi:hypothetical protein